MRVLVTGSAGQVGSDIARSLAPTSTVFAMDHGRLDLRDASAVHSAIAHRKPDVIVNAAAYTAVDRAESERDAAFAINAHAVGVLGAAAAEAGALVIHFSTDYVFDGRKKAPYIESDPTGPLNVYGQSKLEGERLLAASGCRHFIFRTSWVYSSRGRNFVHAILAAAGTKPELRVVSDQHGAPTASHQLASAVQALLADPGAMGRANGLYHLCAAGETTWHGFATAILQAKAIHTPVTAVRSEDYPVKAVRPRNSRLDCGKAAADLGLQLADWREGLAAVMRELP
jgi:dTDP-4-dehydrorhamnose reductase